MVENKDTSKSLGKKSNTVVVAATTSDGSMIRKDTIFSSADESFSGGGGGAGGGGAIGKGRNDYASNITAAQLIAAEYSAYDAVATKIHPPPLPPPQKAINKVHKLRQIFGGTGGGSVEDESGKQQPHFEFEKLNADDMVAECRQKENRLPMPAGPSSQADLLMASSCSSRNKTEPSREMIAALKVINDALQKPVTSTMNIKTARKIAQAEWFQVSCKNQANPLDVDDYIDCFESFSNQLLRFMINLKDSNGNTAMHYAVSHGNFDIVSILLDSKQCDVNQANNAGYTSVMLVSLAKLKISAHHTVVKRLFRMSDVNIRAKKHCQTALMLAAAQNNLDMVNMLLDAGADINIQDADGSTALMCAAEHGCIEIVKVVLSQPDCDTTIQDLEGSTARNISLEAGHRDIGAVLYAHERATRERSTSPYTSLRRRKKLLSNLIAPQTSASTPASPVPSKKFPNRRV